MDMKDEDSHYNGERYYLLPSQSSMIKWSQRQILLMFCQADFYKDQVKKEQPQQSLPLQA